MGTKRDHLVARAAETVRTPALPPAPTSTRRAKRKGKQDPRYVRLSVVLYVRDARWVRQALAQLRRVGVHRPTWSLVMRAGLHALEREWPDDTKGGLRRWFSELAVTKIEDV